MMSQLKLAFRFVCCIGLTFGVSTAVQSEESVSFNRDIRPILSNNCFACHGPDESHRKAGFRLDIAQGEKPDWAELVTRITSTDESVRMPPPESKNELTAEEIDLLRRWVKRGAQYEDHWSFIPPTRPDVPEVQDSRWPRGVIDRFILAKMEEAAVNPAPEAEKITLIRRLYFDLTGIPPTPREVDDFLNDQRPDAYERLVERLLASPRFGERMAIYWLDLVRYADSVGYHGDQEHMIAPYREWVIRAFNENMPFDEFTIRQLAGDLLPNPTVADKIASGYNRVLQTSHEGGVQVQEYLTKYSADRVRNVSEVWMGATMGCAECHNHKFDPYTQKDFYSLAAFFADVEDLKTFRGGDTSPTKREPEMRVLSPTDRAALEEINAKINKIQESLDVHPELRPRLAELKKERDHIEKRRQRTMVTMSVKPRTIRVLERGDWMDKSGEIVTPAIPEFMGELQTDKDRATRLDLAKWLTSPDHPQTSRVFVNRLWYLFFGRGISNSLDDSGSQGEWPTHLELLDWLATEFSSQNWDIKHMVRLIVISSAYRQSSQSREVDPSNDLFSRQGRWRLPAEMIRDQALAVSGLLVEQVGGESARPPQPVGYYAHLNFPKRKYKADTDEGQYRRGVYVHWQRQFLHPMLRAFDAPTREECTAKRPISNTPLQALNLLNDPVFVEIARVFATRIMRSAPDDTSERIHWAWRQALSRAPTEVELKVVTNLYHAQQSRYQSDDEAAEQLLNVGSAPIPNDLPRTELAAWTMVARTLLNLHETITRE